MPCYDPPMTPYEAERLDRENERHNSELAEMLCTVLKSSSKAFIDNMPLEIQLWWIEHQIRDQKREAITSGDVASDN